MSQELVGKKSEVAQSSPQNPSEMLAIAVSNDVDIEKLKQLMALEKEWREERAKEAFQQALSEFQGNCPIVTADKKGHNNNYASLARVVSTIKPHLADAGLTYRFEQVHEKDQIVVTCIVTHTLGHRESMTMQAPADLSGGKNNIQAIASANSYLKRYTLIGSLGVITSDDDDGATAEASVTPVQTISIDQAIFLDDLIKDVKANRDAFLKVCKVEKLEDLPACKYESAKKRLESKKK